MIEHGGCKMGQVELDLGVAVPNSIYIKSDAKQ